MPRVKTLTAKERAFAQGILDGLTKTEAYRQAYPASRKWKAQMVTNEAHDTSKRPAVAAYIEEGRARLDDEHQLTRMQAVGILAKIAKGKERGATTRDKIAAVAQASKMLGYDVPTKVEVKLEGSLLHKIRNA